MSTEGKDKTLEHVDRVLSAVSALTDIASHSEHAWHMQRLRMYADALFARGPFKPGDRVRLTKTPTITQETSWGWLGAKHFLVAGSLGTVQHVDFDDGRFWAYVAFDDDSWVDNQGVRRPVEPDKRGLFRMWETQIEVAKEGSRT